MILWLRRKDTNAVSASATQKAFHTPTAPKGRLRINAAGRMISRYLQRDTTSEAVPLPSPSSAPQEVTETEDTRKPAQMIRRAVFPAEMVSGLVVNIPIS